MPVKETQAKLWFKTKEEEQAYDDMMMANIELKSDDSDSPNYTILFLRETKERFPVLSDKHKADLTRIEPVPFVGISTQVSGRRLFVTFTFDKYKMMNKSLNSQKSGSRSSVEPRELPAKKPPVSVSLHKNFRNFSLGEKISVEVMESLLNKIMGTGEDRNAVLQRIIKDLQKSGYLTEDQVLNTFKLYDTDGSGTISRSEIYNIVRLSGEDMTEAEIEEMIRESDLDGDGEIDFKEFAKVVTG